MSNFEGIPVNEMEMTIHADAADRQCENITYENWDRAMKARETTTPTAHRKTIRRITRPMLAMLALTFAAWLVTLLGSLGVVDPVTAEAVKGGVLLATLIAAIVVTARVMGGVGNAD